MSRFEFIPGPQYYELLVEVGFEHPLPAAATTTILGVILETVTGKIAAELDLFLQGLAALEIEAESLRIQFRFTPTDHLSDLDLDDYVHRRVHFVWYLFARIDSYHALGDVPFPSDFRSWLDISDEYGLDATESDS